MKKRIIIGSIILATSQISHAALLGSELSLQTIFQSTPTSSIFTLGFLTTATVIEPGIEFSSLASTQVINPPLGLQVVDVSINAGDDFIEIDFTNTSQFTSFASAFQNGYIFTFDSTAAINITGASIDNGVTSLGLAANDLVITGNQLFVNVEGLSFNASTFARINLSSTGGVSAVPLPASLWLFGSGLLALMGLKRVKKS